MVRIDRCARHSGLDCAGYHSRPRVGTGGGSLFAPSPMIRESGQVHGFEIAVAEKVAADTFSRPYARSVVLLAPNTEMMKTGRGPKKLKALGIAIPTVKETLAYNLAPCLFDKADMQAFKTS